MPRNITIDHARITNFQITIDKPSGDYKVQVGYTLEEADNTLNQRKTITRHSSGHAGTPKLPAGWEADFDSLIAAMVAAVTTLESL